MNEKPTDSNVTPAPVPEGTPASAPAPAAPVAYTAAASAPQAPAPQAPVRGIRPLFERKASDVIVAALLALLSVCCVSAILWNSLHLGYTLVFDAFLILISVFVVRKGAKPRVSFLIGALLSLVCSASFILTSSGAVKFFTFVCTAFAAFVWFFSAAGKEYKKGDFSLVLYPIMGFIESMIDIPGVFKGFFSRSKNKSRYALSIILGIACALPVAMIVIPLLIRSDVAFNSLMSGLFRNTLTIFAKIVLAIPLAIILIIIVFSLKYNQKRLNPTVRAKGINSASICAFLCVLSSVYLVYLLSQLAYFFSAFSSILPKGYKFTYAEYARRGFFELCVIAFINLLMIYLAVLLSRKNKDKIPLAVKLPSAFIVLFTFIIIATAMSKMIMYIGAYGCTVDRVCTSALMVWMFVLFAGIFIRLFVKRFDVLTLGLVTALIVLAVLGIGNMNARIAEFNYNMHLTGKREIDVEYMARLGDEGIPYLYKLTKDKDEDIADRAKSQLYLKYYDYYNLEDTDLKKVDSYKKFSKLERIQNSIGYYSIPKANAYKILDKYAKENNGKVFVPYYFYDGELYNYEDDDDYEYEDDYAEDDDVLGLFDS